MMGNSLRDISVPSLNILDFPRMIFLWRWTALDQKIYGKKMRVPEFLNIRFDL
jgi:hypothetical protein